MIVTDCAGIAFDAAYKKVSGGKTMDRNTSEKVQCTPRVTWIGLLTLYLDH